MSAGRRAAMQPAFRMEWLSLKRPASSGAGRARSTQPVLAGQAREACSHTAEVVSTAGSSTTKVAPAPAWLSAQMRPPWASTIDFAIANPSPDPAARRRAVPARKKRSKIRGRSSAATPEPLSVTLNGTSVLSLGLLGFVPYGYAQEHASQEHAHRPNSATPPDSAPTLSDPFVT